MVLLLVATILLLVLIPEPGLAWGPITHLSHGSEVLKVTTTLPAALQQLLAEHRLHYLYGCIGADITIAKKYTRALQAHCHSWAVGWQILDSARSEAEQAFAWGYLTHLAADVYSHNHFVPTQLIVSFRARTLRHVYWEARFDGMQPAEYRKLIGEVRAHRFPDCDDLLERVVARTLFSFRTNKRIFDSVLAFHDWENWHHVVRRVGERSRYAFPPELVERYNAACLANIDDLLRHGRHAACQAEDPTGLDALTMAKNIRRMLKSLRRRGVLPDRLVRELQRIDRRDELDAPTLAPAL